jgi:CHAT domain-containing protein/Tfp pilus assembly protein PilF
LFTPEIHQFFFIILSPFFLPEILARRALDNSEFTRIFGKTLIEGNSLRQKGDFFGAIPLFEAALQAARNYRDEKGELTCLMNLAVLNWNNGQVKESSDFYAVALSISQRLGLKEFQDKCLGALKIYKAYSKGKELRSSGQNNESIAQFELAIDQARKIESPEHELKCLRQLSSNYFQLEAIKDFYALNIRALELAQKINHRQETGRCLNNIGLFYWKSNNYSKALARFEESLTITREFKDEEDESAYLNNIAIVYKDIGNYDLSLEYLMQALQIDMKLKEDNGILIDLNNIGAIFRNRGELSGNKNDFQTSLDYYKKSFDISRRIRNKKLEIETLNNIGLVYATLGDFGPSLKYFSLALNKAREINDMHEFSNICINTGNVYLHLNNCGESEKYFQKGLELSLKTEKNEILWEAYFGLGQCFEAEQKYSSALMCYKKAADIIDFIRCQLSLEDYKAGFARDKLKVYEALIHLLYMLKTTESTSSYDEEIFQAIEKAKARAFLEGLIEMANSSQESSPPQFRKEQDEISRKISLTISGLAKPGLPKDQRTALLERLDKVEDEYISLLNKMKSEQGVNSGLSPFKSTSIKEIRNQLLDQKTAILEFFLGEKESFAVLITKTNFTLRSLPSRAEIESSLRAYLKMISTCPDRRFQGISAGKRIYLDLLGSFEGIRSPFLQHLIIVPDGILYYLPFETLVLDVEEKDLKQPYLVELYKISYTPSVSSLSFLVNKKAEEKNPKRLLAIGNPDYSPLVSQQSRPTKSYGEALRETYLDNGLDLTSLPFTKKEVLQISRFFSRDRVDIYLGAKAREEVIKKKPLKDYQIIHFACHGFQDERSPFRSALVLSLDGNIEEDGFLQVREIYNLKLNADLVVLSACQTGRGKLENGEGILGLPRVFFYAGARSTISTLWKINDKSTSDLMGNFYRFLAQGRNKAQALRLAKLEMIKSRYSHPFFWAAFVLNGDYDLHSSQE